MSQANQNEMSKYFFGGGIRFSFFVVVQPCHVPCVSTSEALPCVSIFVNIYLKMATETDTLETRAANNSDLSWNLARGPNIFFNMRDVQQFPVL